MSKSREALLKGLEDGGIAVRMYRPGGLGDCFLVAFPPAGDPRFLLIDCGVFNGTTGGSARMKAIVRDVAEVTADAEHEHGHLHALAATHEHWDHLSGFKWAQTLFERLAVDEVWVAWTEDLSLDLARELRQKRRRTARALAAAVAELRDEEPEQAAAVAEVLGFGAGLDDDGAPLLGADSPGTAKQMDFVCSQWGTPRYLHAGEDLRWPGARFYVLGPPEDRELLERSDPSRVHSEVYERSLALNGASAFGIAALGASGPGALDHEEQELWERAQPFARHHRVGLDETGQYADEGVPPELRGEGEAAERVAAQRREIYDFFRSRYGFGDEEGHGERWRRIGGAWLSTAGQVALQLDSDTNNTSLALAIEHAASGRVLLFPADAQVGNWLSWHRHAWDRDGGGEKVRARELLERTVLYKVGHHGSHNATLRDEGLERMTHPELVAMIPVDEEQAEKKSWAMPFGPLAERLAERCRQRVLRADRGVPEKPANVPAAEWERFTGRTAESELWVQYSVPTGASEP
jgi:hypothetical protein